MLLFAENDIFFTFQFHNNFFVVFPLKQRLREQLQDTNAAAEEMAGIRCDFESECHWTWDKAMNNTFHVVNGRNVSDTGMQPGPSADNAGDVKDHFFAIVCFYAWLVFVVFIHQICLFALRKKKSKRSKTTTTSTTTTTRKNQTNFKLFVNGLRR